MTSEVKEYTKEIEDLFIQFLVSEPELFVRCKGIIDAKYFDNTTNRKAISFIEKHSNEYSTIPTINQIYAVTQKELELIDNIDNKHQEWFFNEFESFCRHKALEIEILNSADLLKEKRYGEVEARIKAAVQIGLVKDLGTDYFDNPKLRLEALKNRDTMIPTGWDGIDKKLYGGTEKGTLTIFAGQSGTGKSLFLQNWALNHAMQGLHVVYITLELSESLCALRLDAMISNYGTKDVLRNVDDVELRVATFSKKYKGSLQIKQMPNGCTANDIRAYIKEYEIQKGIKVDSVMIDYLDLLMPLSKKVSPSDLFVKDKYVSEELRNLAIDLNSVVGTASQLNRCVSGNTMVITDNGQQKDIKNVEPGDIIQTIDGTTKVLRIFQNGKQAVYKIKTKSGKEIKVTSNHRVVTEKGLKSIDNGLRKGDKLQIHTEII